MFTKYTRGRELYRATSEGGREWSEHRKMAGLRGHYQVSSQQGSIMLGASAVESIADGPYSFKKNDSER